MIFPIIGTGIIIGIGIIMYCEVYGDQIAYTGFTSGDGEGISEISLELALLSLLSGSSVC